jgi:hypothetical protein
VDSLAAFLNQPIVLTIVSLTFGGYLVNTIADRRARNDKRREKAIDLLAETASTLNKTISSMYGAIRVGRPLTPADAIDALTALYARRMYLRIASEAYLRSDALPRQYDQVLDELQGVALAASSLEERAEPVASIQARRARLRAAWPIAGEAPRPAVDAPRDELALWLEMILDRVTAMLSTALNAVMR